MSGWLAVGAHETPADPEIANQGYALACHWRPGCQTWSPKTPIRTSPPHGVVGLVPCFGCPVLLLRVWACRALPAAHQKT